ncbi:MAG: hypothetical protein LBS81_01740 [Endomicrobium sp.]|nr:hypothetical protein [Endomicrobium sp.]
MFTPEQLTTLFSQIGYLKKEVDKKVVSEWSNIYIDFIKENYQKSYRNYSKKFNEFIKQKDDSIKVVWGDCLKAMKVCSQNLSI